MNIRSALFWDIKQCRVVSAYWHFGTDRLCGNVSAELPLCAA